MSYIISKYIKITQISNLVRTFTLTEWAIFFTITFTQFKTKENVLHLSAYLIDTFWGKSITSGDKFTPFLYRFDFFIIQYYNRTDSFFSFFLSFIYLMFNPRELIISSSNHFDMYSSIHIDVVWNLSLQMSVFIGSTSAHVRNKRTLEKRPCKSSLI